MNFKLWSETNNEAKQLLKPDLGLRDWDALSDDEKKRIWKYLQHYFFDPKTRHDYESNLYFLYDLDYKAQERVCFAVNQLSILYKQKNFANFYLEKKTDYAAASDFYSIFTTKEGNAVIELLSLYCKAILLQREGKFFETHWIEEKNRTDEHTPIRIAWEFEEFDEFANELNEVFGDFGLNVYLTRNGFIPKQDDKIINGIYEPVIKVLGNQDWKEVNNLLSDAYLEFRKNTSNGFSTCITHTVSAVQAYLQIVVNGKTGSGDIKDLVKLAQSKELIPSDTFSREIFKTIESILMRERQEKGDAHPKKEYATEKNARMVLNLAMVFLQHCITN